MYLCDDTFVEISRSEERKRKSFTTLNKSVKKHTKNLMKKKKTREILYIGAELIHVIKCIVLANMH